MAWQIIFIIFNYISLCNCARALALPFGDEGVALDPRSAAAAAGAGVAAGSGQSLSTGSLFSVLFSCDTKKEAKSQSRCKVGFLLARSACISFGHFAHIAASSSSSNGSIIFVVHRLLAGSVLYFISSAFWLGKFMRLNDFKTTNLAGQRESMQ